jgi:hypothetical protein
MRELFDTAGFSSKNQIGGSIDSAWDDGSAFSELSSLEWAVGDRIAASGDDNQAQSAVLGSPQEEQLCKRSQNLGIVTDVNKKIITITWKNGLSAEYTPKQMQSYGYQKFLEEKEATECNLNNLTSAQELVQDSASLGCNTDLTSSEPQRLTNTAQASLNCDIPELTTTAMCKALPILEQSDCDQEQSTSSQLLPLVPHFLQKAIAKEPTTSEIVSPQSSKLLQVTNPDSPQSKTSQVCSLAPIAQEMSAVTSGMFYSSFPTAGMMRNGSLSEADTLALPSLEKEYCWLPSPGALSSTGKGRPPGQTKQEGGLKKLKAIAPGQVVNPEFLESAYNLPLGWTNPRENKSALELLAEMELPGAAAPPLETPLIGELQRSPSVESSTLTQSLNKLTPEIFLEETKGDTKRSPHSKRKQRKGCLYKYLENKKLKSGAIASYPRVTGHRNPDNPTHWRWGFNWEEKIDGEWKGRSIGSVPLGAIALIQSMQNEGVPLEEIIGFIKRAKTKK